MKEELHARTIDHPQANGRKPVPGDQHYEMRFPMEDGRELVLQMGETGFRQLTDLLLDMVTGAIPHNDGSTNAPVEAVLESRWRHSRGFLFCGTLRIAKADFDTDSSEAFKVQVFDQIVDALNKAREKL